MYNLRKKSKQEEKIKSVLSSISQRENDALFLTKDDIPDLRPTKDEITDVVREELPEIIKPLIPEPIPGKDAVITDEIKKEIAVEAATLAMMDIQVPVVDKIIEKTEVIKEQPIVTQEIKEVAIAERAEAIRDKLESLKDDERLDKSAIKGLDEILNEFRGLISGLNKNKTFGGGIVGRDLIKDIDISSQLDGVTKTFNIPAVWNIVSVDLSSFPHALRKNVDFTYTTTSITFTNEINAGSSLAQGQTCILTVVTA